MWKCQSCGEDIDDEFDACWKCQQERFDNDAVLGRNSINESQINEEGDKRMPMSQQADREASPPPHPAGDLMTYKVVPFNASVSQGQGAEALASKLEGLIAASVAEGWEFVSLAQFQTHQAGSSGCFGIGASPANMIPTEFLVFRK